MVCKRLKDYPLLTQKAADLKLFIQIVKLLSERAHLNKAGLEQIVNIKASLNRERLRNL